MSAFDDSFAVASRDALLDKFGDAVTYTPPGGAGVATTAIRLSRPNTDATRVRAYELDVRDVAAPELNATITDGADVWTITEVEDEVGGLRAVTAELARLNSNDEGA